MDLIQGIDYVFRNDVEGGNTLPIMITTKGSPYEGIIYSYGKVRMKELDDDGTGLIEFQYDILSKHDKTKLETDPAFHQRLGEILTSIITTSLEMSLGEQIETGTGDPEGIIQ